MRGARLERCAVLAALWATGCASSHKVDEKERTLALAPEQVAWASARPEDVAGYFESERVTGEAAVGVRRIYYAFQPDGTYTGAALVQEAGKPAFQTLSGRWALQGGTLRLGDDPPVKVSASPGRLRLESEAGSVVLRRAKSD